MRIALLADIHGNLPALEACLTDIRAQRPDRILSLGDQVNLGPSPRETLALLRAHDAVCLRGNHERYILSAMRGDPTYQGINFASLRFNAALLCEADLALPEEMTIGPVRFCHSMPGDDRFPVNDAEKSLAGLPKLDLPKPTHIVCGHGHNPIHYVLPGLTVHGIGSTGCMDRGVPGVTSYTLMDVTDGNVALSPVFVPYDTRPLHGLFLSGGMADYCPVMAHIACLQMEQNHDYLVPFVTEARARARAAGLSEITPEIWRQTDIAFPWPDGVGTRAFWQMT